MCRKFVYLMGFVLLVATGTVEAVVFTDDFNTPHDYVIYNVTGTRWDGMMGTGPGETVDRLEADMNNPGQLFMQSTNARWEPPTWTYGPFVYKIVAGDFIAEVHVTDFAGNDGNEVYHNDCFILARVPNLADAGPGDDGQSMHYFPTWNGNIFRDINDGGESEQGSTGDTWECGTYLRLEREGDVFRFKRGFNGTTWESLDTSGSVFNRDDVSIERPDLNGLSLQVGLAQGTYSGQTGHAAFDDFSLTLDAELAHAKAWAPYPPHETEAAVDVNFMWNPGDNVQSTNGHDVFWGKDSMMVGFASRTMVPPGVTYRNVSDPCCDPGLLLPYGQTYYWRVDEVNNYPTMVKGDIWEFTVETPKATDPTPSDGAIGVPPETVKVKWTPGKYAVSQDVYFSVDKSHVETSTTPDIPGLAGDVTECNIPAASLPLIRSQTYYWRVDSNNGDMPDAKGDVWSFSTPSIEFFDDFNTPHNYLTDGVEGTGWDGFLGLGQGETATTIEANRITAEPCYPGQLLMQSVNGQWNPGKGVAYMACGPFLYIEVAGDFVATVEITDYPGLWEPNNTGAVYNNSCGIMARVGDLDVAGPNEDWVSVDFFPIWSQGVYARECNDGTRAELISDGSQWNADRFLQLERDGNKFYFRHSPDRVDWERLAIVNRPDMNGLPLQVGLQHATFGTQMGLVAYDDFHLVRQEWPQARGAIPSHDSTNAAINTKLRWTPGDFVQDVNGHYVYFGGDFNEVNDATVGSHPNVDLYIVSDPYADPGMLKLSTQYFWRVDEVNELNTVWRSNVWNFTTAEYIEIDDFQRYSTLSELQEVWYDGPYPWPNCESGSRITISSEVDVRYGDPPPGPVYQGSDAIQFAYDNDATDIWVYTPGVPSWKYNALYYYSGIEANMVDIQCVSDWTTEDVKLLSLYFFGNPNNDVGTTEQMYLAIEDGDGNMAIAKYGDDAYEDMNDLAVPQWQRWVIALSEFEGQGVDITDVNKMYFGTGEIGNDHTPGGAGLLYIDSIRLYPPTCVSKLISGDLTDDCTLDTADFIIMADGWRCEPESPDPNSDPSLVGRWKFDGVSGTTATDSAGGNHGTILGGAALNGTGRITLDGVDDYVSLPISSVIADLNESSFVAWVDWLGGGSWQRIFDFGHPNAVDPNDNPDIYMFMSPNPLRWVITLNSYGAEFIAEGTPSTMPTGMHLVAATVDFNDVDPNNTVLKLYLDGRLAGQVDANLAPSDLGATTANWLGRSLYVADPYLGGAYDEFRIYNRSLSEAEITKIYGSTIARPRSDVNGDGVVDFKDLAMIVDRWLQGPILWP